MVEVYWESNTFCIQLEMSEIIPIHLNWICLSRFWCTFINANEIQSLGLYHASQIIDVSFWLQVNLWECMPVLKVLVSRGIWMPCSTFLLGFLSGVDLACLNWQIYKIWKLTNIKRVSNHTLQNIKTQLQKRKREGEIQPHLGRLELKQRAVWNSGQAEMQAQLSWADNCQLKYSA